MEELFLCGAAKEKITPPVELLGNLRGLMDSQFGGIVDDLFVRVIALKNNGVTQLLISCDLDKVPYPEENMKEIEKQTGVSKENILYISIHTHSAPVTGNRPYEGPNYIQKKPIIVQEATKTYEKYIFDQMMKAVKRALNQMVPAVMGYAKGQSYINVSRVKLYPVTEKDGTIHLEAGTGTNFEREADHTLFVMKFSDLQGKVIALFVNYPVHNTVMILNTCGKDNKVGISSDMGGNVSKQLEKNFDGCIAMWSSGAAGDLNPIMSNQVYWEDFETGKAKEKYETNAEIPLSMLHTLVAHHLSDIKYTLSKITYFSAKVKLDCGTRWIQVPGKDDKGESIPYKVRIHKIKVGPVTFLGFNGELYSGLAKDITESCPDHSLVFINHDASLLFNTGYIYSDEVFEIADKYHGGIVGMDHTWLQPGYISNALISGVKELLSEDIKKLEEGKQ